MARQRIAHGAEIEVPSLEELAEVLADRDPNIIIGMGGDVKERMLDDVPMKGTVTQVTSFLRGNGSDNFVVPVAAFVQLCKHNVSRIAGTIQNIGANPAYVYLASLDRLAPLNFGAINGIIVGYLAASGGVFDFKLTNDVWKGPVSVYSVLGTTLVWGEH
jgi:hypothetical protein